MSITLLRLFGLILGIGMVFPAQAQTTWKVQEQDFEFKIELDSILLADAKNQEAQIVSIKINQSSTPHVFQTIKPSAFSFSWLLEPEDAVLIKDVNFDGYPDVGVISWLGTNHYKEYDFWLYAPERQAFVPDSTLNELMNPTFNPATKTIETFWRIGVSELGCAIYRWSPEGLDLLIEQVESWGIEGKSGSLDRQWRQGKLMHSESLPIKEYGDFYLDCGAAYAQKLKGSRR